MKKIVSIALALVTLFSLTALSVSAAETSLLTNDASKWVCKSGGEGNITITTEGDALVFTADKGWPEASYDFSGNNGDGIITLDQSGNFLNYDFSVSAGANVMIFFNGQNPAEESTVKLDDGHFANYMSINSMISSLADNPAAQEDLPAGDYKGSIELTKFAQGADGKIQISGVKVFAVGGKVTVRQLSVGSADNDVVEPSNTPVATTTVNNNTAATTAAGNTSAKTGDADNVMLVVAIAVVAGAVVTVSGIASKKVKSK